MRFALVLAAIVIGAAAALVTRSTARVNAYELAGLYDDRAEH